MRRLLLTLTAVVGLVSANTAAAAAWNVPSNVRIVQKSNTDTSGRVYPTIQAALTSITDASATKRYLIKVMPGVYSESVTLRPGIDLAGSGQGNTTLTSTSTADFTVKLAEGSTLGELTVTSAGSSGLRGTGAVMINGVSATLQDVTIVMGGTMAAVMADEAGEVRFVRSTITRAASTPSSQKGIFFRGRKLTVEASRLILASGNSSSVEGLYIQTPTSGVPPTVEVTDSTISVTNAGDIVSNAIRMDGDLKVSNSRISTSSTGSATYTDEYVVQLFGGGSAEISNSTVEDASAHVKGGVNAGDVKLANSSVTVKGTAVFGTTIQVAQSTVSGQEFGVLKLLTGTMRLGGSQIAGGHNGVPGEDKVVGCYDAAFNPLPSF